MLYGYEIRKDGYAYFRYRENNKPKTISFHRAVMEFHLGRPLKHKEFVHHIDGNPQNNFLWNLKILTNSQHIKYHRNSESLAHKRKVAEIAIESRGQRMISPKQHFEILDRRNKGETIIGIAASMGLKKSAVCNHIHKQCLCESVWKFRAAEMGNPKTVQKE